MLFTLNESFSVFTNEILLPEHKHRETLKLLELPWDNDAEIQNYLIGVQTFQVAWIDTYSKIKNIIIKLEIQKI